MKLSELKNALTIRLIENATELFRAKKYYSKEFVEKYIGLTLQRSDFYGREQDNGELRPLAKNKTDFNEDKDVTLLIEGIVVLEKEPVNNGLGEIVYKGYGLVEVDDVVIYDGRAGQITDNTYNLASPTTTTVGDLSANTDITGLTAFEIIEQMTVSYQVPSFTFFSISGQANPVEVGSVISGFKSFLWATSNSANVAEPLTIRDVSNSVDLDNQLVNSGSAAIDIGNLNTSTQRTQQFSIQALNTEGSSLSRVYNISILYPYFYGKVSSGGAAAGSNRPVADQALIDSGTKVVSSSSGNISINFNSHTFTF